MTSEKQNKIFTFFLIATSFLSLILSGYLISYPKNYGEKFSYHNVIVGLTFSIVCFIGSVASIYPNLCGKILFSETLKKTTEIHSEKKITSPGHHYPCEKYSNHTLKIGNKYLCATCSGLLIGGMFGIIGSIWYFSGYFQVEKISVLAPLGFMGVFFGLFQSLIPKMEIAYSRFFAGISLVVGSFILLGSLDQQSNNTLSDLFFVVISIFWIFTKINLSQKEHRVTCAKCLKKECIN